MESILTILFILARTLKAEKQRTDQQINFGMGGGSFTGGKPFGLFLLEMSEDYARIEARHDAGAELERLLMREGIKTEEGLFKAMGDFDKWLYKSNHFANEAWAENEGEQPLAYYALRSDALRDVRVHFREITQDWRIEQQEPKK